MGSIARIVVVAPVRAVSKAPVVGKVAFDQRAHRAVGVVEIPAPHAMNEVEGATGLAGGEVRAQFEGADEWRDVGGTARERRG